MIYYEVHSFPAVFNYIYDSGDDVIVYPGYKINTDGYKNGF